MKNVERQLVKAPSFFYSIPIVPINLPMDWHGHSFKDMLIIQIKPAWKHLAVITMGKTYSVTINETMVNISLKKVMAGMCDSVHNIETHKFIKVTPAIDMKFKLFITEAEKLLQKQTVE